MKLVYSRPETEVTVIYHAGDILTVSGDYERFQYGPGIGEDED